MNSKKSYDTYKRYCCVFGCLNKRKKKEDLTFFRIPEDTQRRREWLTAINREDLLDERKLKKAKRNYICSIHFEESATITTISKRLISDAAPTKFLPHKINYPETPGLVLKTENMSTSTLPQTSKKDNTMFVTTYSHTQAQTDPQNHTKETEREIAKPTMDESLNDLKHPSTVSSEPQPSTSQSQTSVSVSTQTDLNKTSNKMTQTTLVLSDEPPRKRKLKN